MRQPVAEAGAGGADVEGGRGAGARGGSASSAAADGVCHRWVTVPTMTASTWSALIPAAASAFSDAAAAMSTTRLVGGGEVAGDDARALADPLVRRVDVLADLVVGDDPRRAVGADAEDAGVLGAACEGRGVRRSRRCPRAGGGGRSAGRERSGRRPRRATRRWSPPCGASTTCSSRLVVTWPTSRAGLEVVADAGVAAVKDPLGRRDEHAPGGRGVERARGAVALDEVAGSLEVVGGLECHDLDRRAWRAWRARRACRPAEPRSAR